MSQQSASRRRFLQAGAAGAASAGLVAVSGGGSPAVAASGGCPMGGTASGATPSAMFGRIFDELPPFAANTPELRQALLEIAAPGGMLDAGDDLFGPNGGPVLLITDPSLSLVNKNNPHDTAGMTFVGQFIDHDLTFDATSRLGVATDPRTSPNARTARFDLDSVYGGGPIAQSELYDPAHPIKLLVESGGQFEDLPRRADHSAVVGDPRNDSNLIISGLHAAFLKFHTNAVDAVAAPGGDPMETFLAARRLTTWHYQWLVVNQVLPNFVGQPMVDDVLARGPRYFHPQHGAYIPVEFSGGAYRFGHSMVRPSYRANLAGDNGNPFFGLIFDSRVDVPDGQNPTSDPGDLRGGFRSARRFVGWQTFFDFGGAYSAAVRPNKVIDTVLSTPLFALPTSAIAHVPGAPGPIALPQRTLLRHLTWSLPSGQDVARRMRAPVLSAADLSDVGAHGFRLDRSTPLWLYVLREAQLANAGQFLGPVGGRIVAEVMIGLLRADPSSYLNQQPGWHPTLGATGSSYALTDFLRFAGVDPATRGQ
ncbi:peroxidase family protein [Nocardioides cynanchi]|uniref:peroxidase family protein n=1 Tax=Nocardioides cynanchi TaxID=2558918 RepID=UPI00177D1422|nr:heme peroxidase family protein [Nocardioides cynanchi]